MSKPAKKTSESELPELPALELYRIVRMAEAERLSGLSEDSLKRNHSDKIIHLGPRAIGMRVGHALHLMNKGTGDDQAGACKKSAPTTTAPPQPR